MGCEIFLNEVRISDYQSVSLETVLDLFYIGATSIVLKKICRIHGENVCIKNTVRVW